MIVTVKYLGTELYEIPQEYIISDKATLKIILEDIVNTLGISYNDFRKETTILVNNDVKDDDSILIEGDVILILQVLGGG